MYPCYQGKTVSGKQSFPISRIIAENLLYLSGWILAGMLLWPLWTPLQLPVLTILWAAVVLVFQILLKKHVCSGCYYFGKRCHLAWGLLSAVLFEQDSGNRERGVRMTLFYIIPPPLITLSALIFAIASRTGQGYWLLLAAYILINALSFPVRRSSCRACLMREICPGSAVSKKAVDF